MDLTVFRMKWDRGLIQLAIYFILGTSLSTVISNMKRIRN